LLGDHVGADFPGLGTPLLLLGHTDTVWPLGTLASMPFRVRRDRAYGPGIHDMKACLVLMLDAIGIAGAERRALRVFLTADEETGSPTGRPHLERAAQGVAAALVVEPPTVDGNLKTARKGLGRFRLAVTGRAAHAGAHRSHGASAIEELAHQILALHALTDDDRGISVNVGVVRGGTADNVVAGTAEAQIDVRVTSRHDLAHLEEILAGLRPVHPEVRLEVEGGWTRPPLERSPGSAALFAQAREHGLALGLDLREEASGGGSDGNLVGALGVPVLDGLGVEGGGAHATDEHVLLPSLPERAHLLAEILRRPGL
jgi:glutamate carboxypeptidase